MSARVLCLTVVLAGCYAPSVNNGELQCSITDKRCPIGFHCAVDNTCWKNGQDPGTAHPDMAESGGMNLTAGSPCSSNGQCTSGFCAPEGVCCDRACTGSCEACNLPGSAGVCSNVPAGGMPSSNHTSCGPDAQSTCMRDGTCDGSGACHLWSDVVCKPGSCDPVANKGTAPGKCDGTGRCVTPNAIACDPYVCLPDNSACYSTCTAPAVGCKPPNPCMSGSCGPKANGSSCSLNADCMSNKCSPDGVCCDMACTGNCEACNIAPNVGQCTAVTSGQPHAGHGGNCAGFGSTSGCGGSCAAGNRATCSFPGNQLANVTCSAQTCASATTQQNAATCNGAGACNAATMSSCGGYVCTGTACLTSCSSTTDDTPCAPGYYCNNPQCLSTKPAGRTCGAAAECTLGFCNDGYCCGSDCSAQCYRCDTTPGSCTPTANGTAPINGRAACGDGSDPVCDGTCNGAGACGNYPTYPPTTCMGGNGWCKGNGHCGPVGCFVAGTRVRTADGPRPIETIAPGDLVYSFDVLDGVEHLRRVNQLQKRRANALVTVALKGGERLVVTPEHYFWVLGSGWVRAAELTIADRLRSGDGALLSIAALYSVVPPSGETSVYNLDVADENTYFVGDVPVLVESCDYTNFSSVKRDELPR